LNSLFSSRFLFYVCHNCLQLYIILSTTLLFCPSCQRTLFSFAVISFFGRIRDRGFSLPQEFMPLQDFCGE
jgi:hypothetical protein